MQPGSKWYHVQLLMIRAFMGNETFLNLKLNNDEWKWNGYGTFFYPTAEGFCGPKGVFAELAGLSPLLLSAWAAGGIWSMLIREMEFHICLQFTLSFLPRSDCFVCLFFILVAGNNYGEMDYRIWRHSSGQSSLYLSHVLWLCRKCI